MADLAVTKCLKILDGLPCYVTVHTPEHVVLWANTATHRDFGEPSGKTCYELYGISQSHCVECPVENTFRDGQIHSKEMTLRTSDRGRISVLVQSSPLLDDNGNVQHVVETAVNVTSVKEMQRQLIMLGQTIAGLAHSMKNIMMGLDGGIYVVNKGMEAHDRKEMEEGWNMVLLNFEKISTIVKDILYCAKEREPNLRKIKPNDVVREVYELFHPTAKRYAIEIKLDLDEELGEAVMDPSGLHSALSNLVTNAMDACKVDLWKDEHTIEIRTKKRLSGAVVIEVADNGVGIDKELKDQVFEEFFSSKGDQGTGLGLMVTQKIMREHGGRITFRSRPGHGTTFVATFPRIDLPEEDTSDN